MTLPSGLKVRVRRLTMLDLAAQGSIPAPLVEAADQVLEGIELTIEDFPKYAPAIDMLVTACIVDPPVASKPDAKHLAVSELPMKDRLAVYNVGA